MEKLSRADALRYGAREIESFGKKYLVYFNMGTREDIEMELEKDVNNLADGGGERVEIGFVDVAHSLIGYRCATMKGSVCVTVLFHGLRYFHEKITRDEVREMDLDEFNNMLLFHALLNNTTVTNEDVKESVDRANDAMNAIYGSVGDEAIKEMAEKLTGKKLLFASGEESDKMPLSASESEKPN